MNRVFHNYNRVTNLKMPKIRTSTGKLQILSKIWGFVPSKLLLLVWECIVYSYWHQLTRTNLLNQKSVITTKITKLEHARLQRKRKYQCCQVSLAYIEQLTMLFWKRKSLHSTVKRSWKPEIETGIKSSCNASSSDARQKSCQPSTLPVLPALQRST